MCFRGTTYLECMDLLAEQVTIAVSGVGGCLDEGGLWRKRRECVRQGVLGWRI